MDNLKLYFLTHLKYWYLYLATLFMMALALLVTLVVGRFYAYYLGDGELFYIFSSITYSLVATPLLLIPNIVAARKAYQKKSTTKMITAATLYHLFTVGEFFLFGYVTLKLIII